MSNLNQSDTSGHIVSEGVVLRGSVIGRSKRIVGDKKTELVTYKIYAGTNIYFVKDWAPKDYLTVGDNVELSISIKPFQKDGRVMIDYTICGAETYNYEF